MSSRVKLKNSAKPLKNLKELCHNQGKNGHLVKKIQNPECRIQHKLSCIPKISFPGTVEVGHRSRFEWIVLDQNRSHYYLKRYCGYQKKIQYQSSLSFKFLDVLISVVSSILFYCSTKKFNLS